MVKSKEYYTSLAEEMIAQDVERDKVFAQIDEMMHLSYQLPDPVGAIQGVHKVTSSDPFDAVRAATNVLSASAPRLKMAPLGTDPENKRVANEREMILSWWFQGAQKRPRATILRDVVQAAMRYDEVCLQTVYLPWEERARKASGRRVPKWSSRHGPFAINVHNPRDVHHVSSVYGLEAVCVVKSEPAHRVLNEWGEAASRLRNFLEGKTKKDGSWVFKHVTTLYYQDEEVTYVTAYPSENAGGGLQGESINLVAPAEHGLHFIPWVCLYGGSNLERGGEHARLPLLYPLVRNGSWATQNILSTMAMSRAIWNFAKARTRITGPSPADAVEYDYDEHLGGAELVRPGHAVEDLRAPELEVGLLTLADRIAAQIGKSTVPAIIQGGEVPAGTAFATVNTIIQQGLLAISPYKRLAEMALEEMFTQMLLWVIQDGKVVNAYGQGKNAEGQELELDPATLDAESLYLNVTLESKAPTDELARINAATIAHQSLGMSLETALEQIGITDPQDEMRRKMHEDMVALMFALEQMKLKATVEQGLQMQAQGLQMQMQQEQQMLAQEAQTGQANQQPMGGQTPPIGDEIGGQGFNPAMGGTPPALANPGATREGQTGMTQGGQPVRRV